MDNRGLNSHLRHLLEYTLMTAVCAVLGLVIRRHINRDARLRDQGSCRQKAPNSVHFRVEL
jgi:hypothetical protein